MKNKLLIKGKFDDIDVIEFRVKIKCHQVRKWDVTLYSEMLHYYPH